MESGPAGRALVRQARRIGESASSGNAGPACKVETLAATRTQAVKSGAASLSGILGGEADAGGLEWQCFLHSKGSKNTF